MKYFIVFACLLAVAFANESADVLRSEQEVNTDSYKLKLELSNSIQKQEEGNLKGEEWEVKGENSHISPEGESVSVQFVANENGYQVVSANPPLPTPPPIPEAIQRAIEYIAAHPPPPEK